MSTSNLGTAVLVIGLGSALLGTAAVAGTKPRDPAPSSMTSPSSAEEIPLTPPYFDE